MLKTKMKISPKKSLGQNFLINAGILGKIVSTAELSSDDMVLEIGPGTGNLTKLLSEKVLQQGSGQAGRVIAIEKDHRLINGLRERFKNTNVEIVEADVLKLGINELLENYNTFIKSSYAEIINKPKNKYFNYKVVGNIPYYITSHLLKTIFEKWPKPKLVVLTIQKEVAQRIMAKPPDMNLLALSVQLYAEPKIIGYVSRGSFRPIPKVDSAIIKLTTYDLQSTTKTKIEIALKLAKKAFAGKRKQLKNTIGAEILNKAGIKP